MTQFTTNRSHYRTLPGHIYTPEGPGRETESIYAAFTLQQMTLTVGGTSPVVAGDYTISFATLANGTVVTTITSAGGESHTALATAIAAAITADPVISALYSASSNAAVVTLIAKSGNTSLALPVTGVPGGTTLTPAISVAAGAPSLRMGLWYVYGTATQPYSIIGSPRGARIGALPGGSTVIADLRGVVARPANQTTLAADFIDSAPDAFRAGQVGFGALRAEVCAVVDPASTALTIGSQVHVVIAAGTYSVLGAVAAAADGGNTIRMDNTVPVRARVVAPEETFVMGSYSGRHVLLQVNQTN